MPTSAKASGTFSLPPPAYSVAAAAASPGSGLVRCASWTDASFYKNVKDTHAPARRAAASTDHLQHLDGIGLLATPGRSLKTMPGKLLDLGPPPSPSRWARFKKACNRPPRLRSAESLRDILRSKVIDANTTVIFDLDHTIIKPHQGHNTHERSRWPTTPATDPVEPNTAHVVQALQDAGVPVFGLTARGCGRHWENAVRTEHQLSSVDVHMHRTSPIPNIYDFDLVFDAGSRHGVAYCGNNTKGEVLERIMQLKPLCGRVVMIDDGFHNFPSLFNAAHEYKLDLTCVWYKHDLSPDQRAEYALDAFYLKYLG